MIVEPVRAFADNYIWMVVSPQQDGCAIVDPGDHRPVIEWLDARGLTPEAILVTHHHGDHVGGIGGLRARWPELPVYGPAGERIPDCDHPLHDGDEVRVAGYRFSVLEVPGHTAGHIAYYGEGALFCGDTLFAGGCGRVFDGTFGQLCASLMRIRDLPPETLVYCAHEYTVDNLGFAKWVEPDSAALARRDAEALALQEKGIPTVPSTLALERETNPFLRWDAPAVRAAAERHAGHALDDDCAVFTELRRWKDSEYD